MKHFLILLMIILLTFSAAAQEKGTIKGFVRDAKTGEGMVAVNVKVKGTYYGAITDVEGFYIIRSMTPGSYTLEFTIIGYTTVQRTDVKVNPAEEVTVNQDMSETVLSLGQEVLVVGDKPLVNLEETSTRRAVSSEDMKAAAVVDVRQVVSQQVGVVETDNEVHIRGGRSHEGGYILDGVSVQDPLAGTGFGLQISTEAVQEIEVITGGYNAEYGQATSGIVNVTLKEGGERYRGSISHKRDDIGLPKEVLNSFGGEIYEGNISGPEPITNYLLPMFGFTLPGKVSFFGNLYAGFTNGYTGKTAKQVKSSIFNGTTFAPKQENNYSGLLKVTYRPDPLIRISYSINQSVSINQNSQSLQTNLEYVEPSPGFQFDFMNILDGALTYTHLSRLHTLSVTHTLSKATFYDLKLSHFYVNLRADANGLNYKDYREPKDIVTFPVEYYRLYSDTIGVIPGDGFYDNGNGYTWHDHYAIENTIKFDLTTHFSEKSKLKTGFEMTFQEMQNIDIYMPWIGELGLNNDIYNVYPAYGAFYLQDNITFSGMILNIGLRFDYWFPGKYVDDAVNNPNVITIPDAVRQDYNNKTYTFLGQRWKGRLSPRVGISHPISDNQMLFFSYGHFSKRPKPQFIYAKLSPSSSQSTFQKFGNPDLNPETTVAYELGVQNQFTNDDVLTITAYYKDIFDYVSTRQARLTTARLQTGNFVTYINQDYARSRGIEVEFKKRVDQWFRGTVSGSYSLTTGKSSTPDQGLLVARGIEDETIKENYVVWDRPLQFNVSTTFNVIKGQPLIEGFEGILDDITVYVRGFYQSGKRYTPVIFNGYLKSNNRPDYIYDYNRRMEEVGEDWFWIDMNIEKYFKFGGFDWVFSIIMKNVLDNKNSTIINPVRGKAYEWGDDVPTSWNDPRYPQLQAPVSPYPVNPVRYLAPRNFQLGLSVKF